MLQLSRPIPSLNADVRGRGVGRATQAGRLISLGLPITRGASMFAGHVGAGLAIGRAERRVNVGLFVAAALLLDLVLWPFVLLGWEYVAIPTNFASTHQVEFVFPYSHSLTASVVWSVLAAAGAWAFCARLGPGRGRVALLVAAAVFSHWPLDVLVHPAELPLTGAGSPVMGLGLSNNMPAALVAEAAVVLLGMFLFIPRSGLPRGRSVAIAVLSLAILALTIVGSTLAPPPPSEIAMAGSSLGTLVVVCALVAWLGRRPSEERA
jgi:hypothetical protein